MMAKEKASYAHEYEPVADRVCSDKDTSGDEESTEKLTNSGYGSMLTAKNLSYASTQIIPCLFAVFINLLDAVTFGTCFFPSTLGETGSLGISLFLFSTLVVQVVLIVMSSFQYGLGTSMAENIPFIHTMAQGVFQSLEATHTVNEMLPTVLTTVCLSTIINGLAFYLVGYLKLGYILHYFPRHVILGMTFGFGIFLLCTCFQVTTGFNADIHIFSTIFQLDSNSLIQLGLVTVVEIVLRVIAHYRIGGEMAGPLVMIIIPLGFYCYLFVTDTTFDEARQANWLFPQANSDSQWYDMWLPFLSYFDTTDVDTGTDQTVLGLAMIEWSVVLAQFPIILSLMTFTLLLVPVRIPTLSMLTGDDVDFDEELKAQGMGNIVSGAFGSVHNYLSYSNSVFFFNVGGWGKTSQGAIALATLILFVIGPQIINYVPRIIAGVIMFHLGYDLVNDAVILSRPALDSLEYMSVLFVGCVVMVFGFVTGIVAGGVSACVTFVVQSSKNSSVRGVFTGEVVRSNTAWTGKHRDKLERGLSKKGIYVIQLQGHIFFGNIQQVLRSIESIIIEACESASIDSKNAEDDVQRFVSLPEITRTRKKRNSITSPLDYGVTSDSTAAGIRKDRIRSSSDMGNMQPLLKNHRTLTMQNNTSPAANTSMVNNNVSKQSDHCRFPEFVVLDCSFVTGFDANATVGLFKLKNKLANQEFGGVVPLPIYLFFAGVQESMQDMFNVHMKDGRHSDNDDDTVGRARNEFPEREEIDSDFDVKDDFSFSGDEDPLSDTDKAVVSPSLNDTILPQRQHRKKKRKSQSSKNHLHEKHFHLDVNTALQSVEEHIIARVNSPDKELSRLHKSELFGSFDHQDEDHTGQVAEMASTSEEIEASYALPSDFEMVTPLQQVTATNQLQLPISSGFFVGSPPMGNDHHCIPLIPSGGMAALTAQSSSLHSSYAGSPAPGLLSPRKMVREKRYTDSSISQSITGRLRRLSLPATLEKSDDSRADVSPTTTAELEKTATTSLVPWTSNDVGVPSLSMSSSKSSALQQALDNEERTLSMLSEENDLNSMSFKTQSSSLSQSPLPLRSHIPPPPVPSEVLKNVVIPIAKKPILTNEEFKQKKLIRKMVYELELNWRDEDFPVIKRLSWYLLKEIKQVEVGDSLWEGNEEATAMGLLISGRLEAVTARPNVSPSVLKTRKFENRRDSSRRTLQVIMPGTLIGELGLLAGVNHSRTIVATKHSVVALLTKKSLAEIEKFDLALLCLLQRIALKTAAGRSKELMLFSAGAIGPS